MFRVNVPKVELSLTKAWGLPEVSERTCCKAHRPPRKQGTYSDFASNHRKMTGENKSIKKEGLPVGIQPSPKVPGAREAGDSQLNVEPAVPTVGGGSR